jgi:hypothetical protein
MRGKKRLKPTIFLTENRRGLSTIVITLIIIVISLVAVGLVWVVVRNLINAGTGGLEINSKCLNIVIDPAKINCSNAGVSVMCDVQFTRTGTGNDVINGVKLVFRNSTSGASSNLISLSGNIEKLVGKKQTGINTSLLNTQGVNTLEITAFFKDTAGNDQSCPQTFSSTNFS